MKELKDYVLFLESENEIMKEVWRDVITDESSSEYRLLMNNDSIVKKIKAIIDRDEGILKDEYKVLEFKTQYTVDKTSEEDSKWEGVKEVEAFKDLGYEILKKGAFKKEMYSGRGENNGRTTYVFTVKVLK